MNKQIKKGHFRRFLSLTGQAVVELAIFGTLVLTAFSVLLIYGQNLNNTQKIKMEAFRKALQKAYYNNSSVSYTVKRNSRVVDLFSAFGLGQPSASGATASVMWQKGAPGKPGSDPETFAYYQINDDVFKMENKEKKSIDYRGKLVTVNEPVSTWSEGAVRIAKSKSIVNKQEDDSIANTRSIELDETLDSTLHTRFADGTQYAGYGTDIKGNGTYYYDARKRASEQMPKYTDSSDLQIKQGAYLDSDGKISYKTSPNNVWTPVKKERTWQTGE